jgi:predicted metal-binding membrane protein
MKRLEIESLLQKDRLLVFSGLAVLTILGWAYMIHMAMNMTGTGMNMTKPCLMHWGMGDILHLFVMWTVMMAAMMLPAATPMIMMFANVNGQRTSGESPLLPTWFFVLGYLAVWTAYSGLATLAQWGLHLSALLTHHMVITSPLLGGLLLLAAGIFQWTPFRDACMSRCRSPLGFLMTEWREGRRGALIMGLKAGLFCVGCCWLLMTLSFVLGVMNMIWMAAITAFMLVEKVIDNKWISRIVGLLLVAWGLWVLAGVIR